MGSFMCETGAKGGCKVADRCYRVQRTPHPYRQSWMVLPPSNKECGDFVPMPDISDAEVVSEKTRLQVQQEMNAAA